jgi:IMP dehydrogenase
VLDALAYDDVLLAPQFSDIHSRADVSLDTVLVAGGWPLKIPIIAANMQTVTGAEMAFAMSMHGGVAFLPRFNKIADQVADYRFVTDLREKTVPTIGLDDWDRVKALSEWGCNTFCVDVAHGDHQRVEEFLLDLSEMFNVIVGNIATYTAARRMMEAGAVGLKVGVGPGAACTTREVTGHGVPQLTAVMEVARAIAYTDSSVTLIADGGIKNSGDIVKALAAGADTVMIGRLLAGCDEAATPGYYAGNASNHVRDEPHHAPEGVHGAVAYTGSVKTVLKSLTWGIRSGLSYSGAQDLKELRENAEWMRVSPQSAIESGVRL